MPSVVGASHVSFSVSDLSSALEWFERVFGAQVMMREPGEDRSAAVLTLPGSELLIGLVSFREGSKERFDPSRTGLDHFAFSVAKESDLGEWKSHLDDNGVAPGAILNFQARTTSPSRCSGAAEDRRQDSRHGPDTFRSPRHRRQPPR